MRTANAAGGAVEPSLSPNEREPAGPPEVFLTGTLARSVTLPLRLAVARCADLAALAAPAQKVT